MITTSNTDLCQNPFWQASDLGRYLPDTPHATSVALPLWKHVIAYEEGDPEVLGAMACGYPRFVMHPLIRALFTECERRFARTGEQCFAFPSRQAAERAAAYVTEKSGQPPRIEALGINNLHALVFPAELLEPVKKYWQHFGEIVSSRCAEAALEQRQAPAGGEAAKQTLRLRIAELAGGAAEDVFLHPSGMAALAACLRAAQTLRPGARSIQIGFPYVDLLKIQTVTGPGAHFFSDPGRETLAALPELLREEPISAIFCEVPGNPLLRSVDLPRLDELARRHDVPLIVDDTAGTFLNIDLRPYADLVVSSLTKSFSGTGDVMAGSIFLNQDAPQHAALREALLHGYEDLFWGEDAIALEQNSRDFPERMAQINTTTETLCDWLRKHPAVARVYYPKYETPAEYEAVKRPGGGYGCLFSLLLHDAPKTAPAFYDRLRVCKGPSLGNNFTLACPYILLAHYQELDWAEAEGLDRHLVRVSVGLESPEDLIARFQEALEMR